MFTHRVRWLSNTNVEGPTILQAQSDNGLWYNVPTLAAGTVVKRPDGTRMTVESVESMSCSCVWFEDDVLHRDKFPASLLTIDDD